jgi:hypothetical protein
VSYGDVVEEMPDGLQQLFGLHDVISDDEEMVEEKQSKRR